MAQRIRMSQLLSDQVITTTANILNILQKILENIRFRARQSLYFRVNWSSTYKREEDSNFQLILLLKSLDDEDLVNWLNSTSKTKYNLPEIQNKILDILGSQVRRERARNIQSSNWLYICLLTNCCKHTLILAIGDFIWHLSNVKDFLHWLEHTRHEN